MKEMFKEAERLYKQIDKAQVHLINARLNNDEEGKKSAISEMETAMCNAMQLLKYFIERKDNIVDLSEVWKDGNQIPQKGKKVVVVNDNGKVIGGYLFVDKYTFTVNIDPVHTITSDISNLYRWAYLYDLLPKGGDAMINLNKCKFGDKLKTRKGLMAVYICHGISDKNTHICVVGLSSFDYEKIVCDRNGKTYLRNDDDRYDIVGKWEDEV